MFGNDEMRIMFVKGDGFVHVNVDVTDDDCADDMDQDDVDTDVMMTGVGCE